MNTNAVLSSASDRWATPSDLYAALNQEFAFDFDPARWTARATVRAQDVQGDLGSKRMNARPKIPRKAPTMKTSPKGPVLMEGIIEPTRNRTQAIPTTEIVRRLNLLNIPRIHQLTNYQKLKSPAPENPWRWAVIAHILLPIAGSQTYCRLAGGSIGRQESGLPDVTERL